MIGRRSEGAVVTLEFALFAVALIGAVLLVSMAWRATEARGQVRDAASEAARMSTARQYHGFARSADAARLGS